MAGRGTGPTEAQSVEPEETDHPAEKEGAELVGVTTRGAPWYYDPDANLVLEQLPDQPESWSEHEDVGTEEVREMADNLEEGWESITERGRELLGLAEESETDADEN